MKAEILVEVKKEIQKMLDAGFIRTCRYAEWISNVVPVEKKDGRWRVAIDFRNLNSATPKDEYPMPVAETLINAAAGHKILSFMDGNAGYNQIFMAPEDIHKTAFRVPDLSHRGILTKGYSRLCGAENTREKRALRRAGIRRGNSLPEGEIDAIVTAIELDIISITIVIISTIITAVSTAGHRHCCSNLDKTLLDTSCSGSFTRNKEEFKRDLLDRIQENTEGWENDKDRESGIIYDYKCIEAFMDTDKFRNMSATYGLDSQVAANLYKAFASNYELPKKNFDKYHEPYKDKIDSSINKCVVVETADHVIPEAYIEKTPFPAKMKEYSVISSAVHKSEKKPIEPEEQIKVEPVVAIVKDLVTENVEDGHIIFCEDASNIVSHPNKPKQVSVPMLSVRIGDHCYYGLCDIGASVSAIPYELYTEIMHEIGSCELEDIDVVIQLANRETISPIGIVRDVEVLCGKIKYPADFLVLGSAASDYCPIIFGRPFLNTCGAIIDCKKEKILTKFAGESYEFNFSKFTKTPYKADLPSNDFKMEQCASIVLVPNNPLQQHLENSESEVFRKERDELEEIFLRQPILKHDLPVEDLGTTPPPKEDPVFDLKPLPDNLKYAHIDDKKIYPVIISSKLTEFEEERLLQILKKHRGAIGYTLDDLKGISPSICQHAINMEDDAKPVVEPHRLIPKMKDVVRNEVLRLLEAGIIYPIADSRWVSPVHCVPKKGGMTVVPNDNDELIPQRVVVGYRMCIDYRKVNKMEPNEPINTKFYQLGNGGNLIFENDLDAVSEFLGRPHPEFHGVQLDDTPGGELQWVITADLRGKMEPPTSERILFSFRESNWLDGLARALQEALARLCGQNVVRLLASRYAHLVRRDAAGVPMELQPHPELRHHAHLDFMLYQTQKDLDASRAYANQTHAHITEQGEAIKLLNNDRRSLRQQRAKKDATIRRLRARIASLEATVKAQEDQIRQLEDDEEASTFGEETPS
ncbi:hypothetical protein QYE76_024838 [Lolium multiflorum]|uniref:Reverse transcriptase domain-containing protein n=1 Tax=Lolium multiflorum TaxID=4521 RepID=A0AAD8REG3_LOLMU|nr:hypothetical protein QYE76_024838 [Lolium multiflorum]